MISQSRGSNSKHSQDGLLNFNLSIRMSKKGDLRGTLNVIWLLVPHGLPDYFTKCWSAGHFPHNHLQSLLGKFMKRENMQKSIFERISHKNLDTAATAAKDHAGCHSCELRIETRRYNSPGFTKIEQQKTKTLPDLMSPDFSCDIQMAGSEFGIKFMKAWIHPALYQKFKALLVVV